MSRVLPTAPGWWWGSLGGAPAEPMDVYATSDGRLLVAGMPADDPAFRWLAPALTPAEVEALRDAARSAQSAARELASEVQAVDRALAADAPTDVPDSDADGRPMSPAGRVAWVVAQWGEARAERDALQRHAGLADSIVGGVVCALEGIDRLDHDDLGLSVLALVRERDALRAERDALAARLERVLEAWRDGIDSGDPVEVRDPDGTLHGCCGMLEGPLGEGALVEWLNEQGAAEVVPWESLYPPGWAL